MLGWLLHRTEQGEEGPKGEGSGWPLGRGGLEWPRQEWEPGGAKFITHPHSRPASSAARAAPQTPALRSKAEVEELRGAPSCPFQRVLQLLSTFTLLTVSPLSTFTLPFLSLRPLLPVSPLFPNP